MSFFRWCYYSENKENNGTISLLSYVKNSYIFAKFIMELVALAVKSSWVSGITVFSMPIFAVDVLGLAVVL